MGPLRVLVNSAGIGWAQRTVGKDGSYDSAANLDAFKKVIAINLIGSFDCIRLAATAMSVTEPLEYGERGAIVNIASVAGLTVFSPGGTVYSGTKFAVRAISEGLRHEVGGSIRTTTIEPGAVDSELKFGSSHQQSRDFVVDFYKHAIPAQSVARAIAFAIEQPAERDHLTQRDH